MTTSTPTPSPHFRVVRGARSLLDLRPIEEVPFHVAVESAFKEGQIVALVTVDDPRLQTGERAWLREAVKALVAGCNPSYGKPREWIVSRDLVTALVAAIGAA